MFALMNIVHAQMLFFFCSRNTLNMSKCEHLDRALICAAEHGHLNRLKLLLEAGADVNMSDEKGSTALVVSMKKGNFYSALHLIKAGADVNACDTYGKTAVLTLAAKKDDIDCVRCLIKAGADVNTCDKLEDDVFDYQCNYSFSEVIQEMNLCKMLKDGDPESVGNFMINCVNSYEFYFDKDSTTPLIAAATRGHLECVQLLLQAGADVNARTKDSYPALVNACFCGHGDVVSALLNAGADTLVRDYDGSTALAIALESKNIVCATILLQSGIDVGVNLVTARNGSALHLAASLAHQKCLQMLIRLGADLDARDWEGLTPLMRASVLGNEKAMRMLLKAGADPMKTDNDERTALFYAIPCGNVLCVKHLTNEVHNAEGSKILAEYVNSVMDFPHNDIQETFSDYPKVELYDFTPLMLAATGGYRKILEELLAAGAHVGRKSAGEYNALEVYLINRYLNSDMDDYADESGAMLLLAAGETVQASKIKVWPRPHLTWTVPVPEYLRQEDDSLKSCCRTAIRQQLLRLSPLNLFHRIPQLLQYLPSILVEYLLFNVSLNEDEDKEENEG